MPHVADGELHAWLDGALEETAPERVAAVAGHLQACGDCRARLEEARDLRDRTAELLEATAPESSGLPPLEELVARAGAAPRARAARGKGRLGGGGRRRPGRLPPRSILTWAAVLLVGAALGWGARTAWRPAPEGRLAVARGPVPVVASAPDALADEEEPAAEPMKAEAAPARALSEEIWIPVAPELAARWLGGPLLSVEGFPVVDIAVSASRAVRVARLRQRLPSGELLEVRHRPASRPGETGAAGHGEPAAAEASAAPPEAVAVVDGFEVRLRGPVAPDSLRVLLSGLVRGMP